MKPTLCAVILLLGMIVQTFAQATPHDAHAKAMAEYKETYREFQRTMSRLRLAEMTAEMKLLFTKFGMDAQAAEKHALGFAGIWPSVVDQLVTRLSSEVDATTKAPKGAARHEAELRRATLILAIHREGGRNVEALAKTLFARKHESMSQVLAQWLAGEVRRREQP